MIQVPFGRVCRLAYEMRYEQWLFDVDLSDFTPWQKRRYAKQNAQAEADSQKARQGMRTWEEHGKPRSSLYGTGRSLVW